MTDGVIIYHNPRCSKSRESLGIITEKGIEPQIIKYLDTPPDADTIQSILKMLNIEDPREIMRKHEKEFKDNHLDNPELSSKELIDAMVKFPKLIERPIVVKDGKAVIGRPPNNVLDIL